MEVDLLYLYKEASESTPLQRNLLLKLCTHKVQIFMLAASSNMSKSMQTGAHCRLRAMSEIKMT